MKKKYTLLFALLISALGFSQNYEFGIIYISDYNFKIVAIPDFTTTQNTNNLDAGFTLMLPAGTADVANQVGLMGGRTWDVTEYDAATLSGFGLGDGTRDAFQFNLPAGSTTFQHAIDEQIDLVSFDVINMPTSGLVEFLLNSDPIATAAGIFDSFYQTDLDGPGGNATQDYFSVIATGLESFSFSTLGIENTTISDTNISIYPNPTKGNLNIETNKTVSYSIYNILGQSVKLNGLIENESNKSLNLSHLPDGIYILKVKDENKNTKSFKIIKKE